MDFKKIKTNNILKKRDVFDIPDFINPKKAWRYILYVVSVLFLFGIVFDYLIYNFVNREPLYVEVPGEEVYIERLKINKIESITNFFDNKIQKKNELKRTNLVDPAL